MNTGTITAVGIDVFVIIRIMTAFHGRPTLAIKISAQASIVIPITAAIGNTSYGLSSDSHIQYA